MINDIPGYETFTKVEPLNKGWSTDIKFRIEAADGRQLLLRVADINEYDRKKSEFEALELAASLNVPVSRPVAFGLCHGGGKVYSLLSWLEGEDLRELLPRIPESEQYALGIKAGELMKRLHSLPAPENAEPWGPWFRSKTQGRIDFYNANPIRSASGDIIVSYLQRNCHLIDNRPQTFNHGDPGPSNLILTPGGQVGAIDFNCFNRDHGDPWWDFDFAVDGWGTEYLGHYCTGLLNGYFGGRPTDEFFRVNSYYMAYGALAALCDTSVGNQGEPEIGRRHMENVMGWFNNMQNHVPPWYLENYR